MGKQTLKLTYTGENIQRVEYLNVEEWHFMIRCGHCGEMYQNEIYFTCPIESELIVSFIYFIDKQWKSYVSIQFIVFVKITPI